ncbi:MAG TPA: hypothetical protein ENI06_07260 [Spirochaetales bacterium]|nr:hypothetical protein [Spirochaetales bacterium]
MELGGSRSDPVSLPHRSLPPGGESIVPEERRLIDFRREIEEVIRKEEVPLNYREYIKNYFLKINIIQD